MELLEKFGFYTLCKNTLIESYGDVEIAKNKIKNSGFSHIEDHIIEENLLLIKESLGSKIMNFISKKVGGDISKLDTILANIKDEEIKFIHEENEAESKYYKLTAYLAKLKKEKSPETDRESVTDNLKKLERFLRDLVRSHESIMDDLEKQVDILTKDNKRKTEYYNLKRAEDSVETKKLRAQFKKKLIKDLQEDAEMKKVYNITGTSEDADKEAKESEEALDKRKKDF